MCVRKKKEIISWCLFDFANSSYSAVIAAVVFPVYYTQHIAITDGDLWWGRAISLSMAVIAITSPFLGGVADIGGIRKRLLFIYTMASVTAIAMFSMLERGMAFEGFILILIANIGMEGGLVFYNSFLPEITDRDYQGRVSAWGYGIGYIGSILSLLLVLPIVRAGRFDEAWIVVSLVFFVFSIPAFIFLPKDRKMEGVLYSAKMGAGQVWRNFKKIWAEREQRKFLLSYFIYEDGVNTVIVFSSIFAASTLGFGHGELIGLYIVVQITALVGAFLMARPIDYWGPKKVVLSSLTLWVLVTILAYFSTSKTQFWAIAVIAGLGLGTVQAATRAFFAQFIPHGLEAEYFGVYSLVGKSSAVMGPYLFGLISSIAKSQRPAIVFVAVFFLVGLYILKDVKGGYPNVGAKGSPS